MKKRILSIVLMAMLSTVTACGNEDTTEDIENEITEKSVEDSYQYNISALLSEDNTYNQILLNGFSDALCDYLGEEHINIITSVVTEDISSDTIAESAVNSSCDMIFTAGKPTLESATYMTDEIPIIATGIIDFKGALHIANINGKTWDKTTGKNVTGISSKPSIVDQVSLMIEATKDLQTVGILYSPEDTDAIYQNEIFEAYLDQAGIPWKEYLIPASDAAIEETDGEEQNSTALTPSKFVAYNAKEGMDNDVASLVDGTIAGLNSPSSNRVALVSDYWTGGKTIVSSLESDSDNGDDTSTALDNEASDDKEIEFTLESRIEEVCNECSAIYIPFGSILTDQMETIGSIAGTSNVVIVAGDTNIGEYSLVTLFSDPYSLGYAAGKKAVRVFNGDDISTIKIGNGSSDDVVKLYNNEIAEVLGIEFPKSFSEINEFLTTYEYGSTTARYSYGE